MADTESLPETEPEIQAGAELPEPDPYAELEIPEFLRRDPNETREEHAARWASIPLTQPASVIPEEWREREKKLRDIQAQKRRDKNAAALSRLKEQHAGERYDRGLKCWMPITATVTEDEDGATPV